MSLRCSSLMIRTVNFSVFLSMFELCGRKNFFIFAIGILSSFCTANLLSVVDDSLQNLCGDYPSYNPCETISGGHSFRVCIYNEPDITQNSWRLQTKVSSITGNNIITLAELTTLKSERGYAACLIGPNIYGELEFIMNDAGNDGFTTGYYDVFLDDNLLVRNSEFSGNSHSVKFNVNCPSMRLLPFKFNRGSSMTSISANFPVGWPNSQIDIDYTTIDSFKYICTYPNFDKLDLLFKIQDVNSLSGTDVNYQFSLSLEGENQELLFDNSVWKNGFQGIVHLDLQNEVVDAKSTTCGFFQFFIDSSGLTSNERIDWIIQLQSSSEIFIPGILRKSGVISSLITLNTDSGFLCVPGSWSLQLSTNKQSLPAFDFQYNGEKVIDYEGTSANEKFRIWNFLITDDLINASSSTTSTCFSIEVEIDPDDFPQEITWNVQELFSPEEYSQNPDLEKKLLNSSRSFGPYTGWKGQVKGSGSWILNSSDLTGTQYIAQGESTLSLCSSSVFSTWVFEIYDSDGDGICCPREESSIKLHFNKFQSEPGERTDGYLGSGVLFDSESGQHSDLKRSKFVYFNVDNVLGSSYFRVSTAEDGPTIDFNIAMPLTWLLTPIVGFLIVLLTVLRICIIVRRNPSPASNVETAPKTVKN